MVQGEADADTNLSDLIREEDDTANYRIGSHRTVVYELLSSQVSVHLTNRLPNRIENTNVLFSVKGILHCVGEFLEDNIRGTVYLKTEPGVGIGVNWRMSVKFVCLNNRGMRMAKWTLNLTFAVHCELQYKV